MKTHLAVSADSSALAAEPWLCACSSVPLLCSLDPGQTKYTQTGTEMPRTNGDGHSGDPFQLENYRLGISIACYMEFHPAARGRSLLIPTGEIQPITLSHISRLPGQSCMGSTRGTFRGCLGSTVLVLPWVQRQQMRVEGVTHFQSSSGSDCHPHQSLYHSPLPRKTLPS